MYIETSRIIMNNNENSDSTSNSNSNSGIMIQSVSDIELEYDSLPELLSSTDDDDDDIETENESENENSPTAQDRAPQVESIPSLFIPNDQSRSFLLNSDDSFYNQFYSYFQGIADQNQSANHFVFPSQVVSSGEPEPETEPEPEPESIQVSESTQTPELELNTPPRTLERNTVSGSSSIIQSPPPPPPPRAYRRRNRLRYYRPMSVNENDNENIAYPALDISALLMASFNQLQNQQEEAQYQRDLEAATQASMNEEQPVTKRVIQDGLFDTFEKIEYNNTLGEELGYTRCPIDYEEFEEGEILVKLPCGHCYSYQPIEKWLTTESSKCPMCREEMQFKEIVVKQRIEENNNTDNE